MASGGCILGSRWKCGCVCVCGVWFHKYPVGGDHVGKKFWSKGDEARQQFIIIFVDEFESGGVGGDVCLAF